LKKTITICFSLTALLLTLATTATAQDYEPVGVQTNVSKSTVFDGGWIECYTDLYATDGVSLVSILDQCQGERMMLACSQVAGNEFVVLGQALYADVTFDTGTGNTTNEANDIEWYYDESSSWGFAPLGETVSRTSCDTNSSQAEQRLCWHTNTDEIDGGWRCGTSTGLNDSTDWVRHILINGEVPEAAPVPVNNFYLLALLTLLLSGFGYIAIRRHR